MCGKKLHQTWHWDPINLKETDRYLNCVYYYKGNWQWRSHWGGRGRSATPDSEKIAKNR